MDIGILNVVTYLPLLGAAFILFFLSDPKKIRYAATIVAAIDFLASLALWWKFDPKASGEAIFQFRWTREWIPSLGVKYDFGIDGIALLLILLTTFMGLIAIWSSFTAIDHRQKEYYVLLLLLQTGMLGTFCALDFFLFYVFWEIMLVPMYFIIGVWGGPRKLYAAIKFFLYTLSGSVLMLLGILTLYFKYYEQFGVYTFEIAQLMKLDLPLASQQFVFWTFFIGFAIKVPMFPFHTWLPDAHVEAPTAGSVILAGVLLKMGTYGFLRFCLPLFPDASVQAAPVLMVLAVIGIVYGALVALVQRDVKK